MSIRVPVGAFRPDKSQRRCARRNGDLRISYQEPAPSREKFELYEKYVRQWHARNDVEGASAFEAFLYDSPLDDTLEFEYRDSSGRLLAVGICDRCPKSLSTVYFYFDPDDRARGLGTFGALNELAFAREHGMRYYYLGYWVKGCGAMEYKRNFRPNEVLQSDGVWRRLSD